MQVDLPCTALLVQGQLASKALRPQSSCVHTTPVDSSAHQKPRTARGFADSVGMK